MLSQKRMSCGISSCATAAAWIAPVEVPTARSKLTFLSVMRASSTPTWNAPLAPPPLNTIARPPAIGRLPEEDRSGAGSLRLLLRRVQPREKLGRFGELRDPLLADVANDLLKVLDACRQPFELVRADLVLTRVARFDVSLAEQLIAAPLELRIARPHRFQSWLDVLGQLAQLVQIVRLRTVQGADQAEAVIETLGRLMEEEGGEFTLVAPARISCALQKVDCALEP